MKISNRVYFSFMASSLGLRGETGTKPDGKMSPGIIKKRDKHISDPLCQNWL